jgi:hypothetical protein
MVNYSNGKIYKIEPINGDDGDIYIGSTTKAYLSQRMDTHRQDYKKWKEGKCTKTTSYDLFNKYGVINCQIILLETVVANSKDELIAREQYYIKNLKCVNKKIEGRTRKEYQIDNYEKISKRTKPYMKIYNKQYKITHREECSERNKIYYQENKDEMKEYYKEYYKENKERINKNRVCKVTCECGSVLSKCNKTAHIKSKKHQNYILLFFNLPKTVSPAFKLAPTPPNTGANAGATTEAAPKIGSA